MKKLLTTLILCATIISSFCTTAFANSSVMNDKDLLDALSAEYGIEISFATDEAKASLGFVSQPSARSEKIDEANLRQVIEANIQANEEAEVILKELGDSDWMFFDVPRGQNVISVNENSVPKKRTSAYFEKAWSPTPSGGKGLAEVDRTGTMINSVDYIGYTIPVLKEGVYAFEPSTLGYKLVDGGRSISLTGTGRMYYVSNGQLLDLFLGTRTVTLP